MNPTTLNLIREFNRQMPSYGVMFAHESGFIKAINRASRINYIFEKVGDEFVIRGEASDPNVSANYHYFVDSAKKFINGKYLL